MRSRLLGIIAASAVLAVVGGLAPASAGISLKPAARGTGSAGAPLSVSTVLVNRIGNPGSFSVLSQDFTDPGFDIYDAQLADDFTVPSTPTKGWKVTGMRAVGIFFGPAATGPCDSETVTIY